MLCQYSIFHYILYSYSNVVHATIEIIQKEIKVKLETFNLVENFDLVENFAVTNFSTKSVDHCTKLTFYTCSLVEVKNFLPQWVHAKFPDSKCLLLCSFSWPGFENFLPHCKHSYGFSSM